MPAVIVVNVCEFVEGRALRCQHKAVMILEPLTLKSSGIPAIKTERLFGVEEEVATVSEIDLVAVLDKRPLQRVLLEREKRKL